MRAERMKVWLFVLIAVSVVGFVLACPGCVSEETRDGRGTTRSYHRSALIPESTQLRVGGRVDSDHSIERDRK